MRRLRILLKAKPLVRILEAHNGLTGLIVENAQIEEDYIIKEFDGIWISSLTDSTAKGKPDIEYVDLTSRLKTIEEILESILSNKGCCIIISSRRSSKISATWDTSISKCNC